MGVLAGAFGGATIAEQLAPTLARVPALAPYAEGLALALVVGVITYLSLILGELVPKRLALSAPERVASLVARPLRLLSRVAGPVVRLRTGSTNLVLRLFGVRASAEPGVTEEEIRALVAQGAETGVVQQAERGIVERAFRLGDRTVGALMTPRPACAGPPACRASGGARDRRGGGGGGAPRRRARRRRRWRGPCAEAMRGGHAWGPRVGATRGGGGRRRGPRSHVVMPGDVRGPGRRGAGRTPTGVPSSRAPRTRRGGAG